MEKDNLDRGKNKSNSNRRSITLKMLVDEDESILIRGKLNQHNESSKSNKFKREKSMSEFLREIVLNSLLNLNNSSQIDSKIEQMEKYVMRTITLLFESIRKSLGEEEAKKILKMAKLNVVALDDEPKI